MDTFVIRDTEYLDMVTTYKEVKRDKAEHEGEHKAGLKVWHKVVIGASVLAFFLTLAVNIWSTQSLVKATLAASQAQSSAPAKPGPPP
jgi:hypothetical protein